ncbi:helix-turn-helix domain-containing protein [Micromonospora sp. NPDC000207]|uniref:helix-turn-helix domain-containing protein n=1 Tax=Micromonospora sp. NPDC000207 TaxID=3154246 RepID=UPI003318157A
MGRRVAYWRSRRNLSQQVFADRIGKSKSWVDKVERGVRRLDKMSVLQDVADALGVDVALLTNAQEMDEVRVPGEVGAIAEALTRYDAVVGPADGPDRPVRELAKATAHGWLALQYGRYDQLLQTLPVLLRAAQRHRRQTGTAESASTVSQAYQLTTTVLRRLGQAHLAWIAADRALTAADDTGDQLLAACAAVPLGGVVRDMGQPRRAFELCVSVAHRMAPPDPHRAADEHLSVYGSLLLQAAMSASQMDDDLTVSELVDQADDIAERIGDGQNYHWTAFGPALVDRVRIAAAVELGNADSAIDTHQRAIERPGWRAQPPGARAEQLVDAARGYAHLGRMTAAGAALLEADLIAPGEVRVRPAGRALLETVLRRTRRPDPRLTALGEALGLDGAR